MESQVTIDIAVDLSTAKEGANQVREMLLTLRQQYDLGQYEYCKLVRIAPLEIPHSHPVVTLSTFAREPLRLLAMYVHEQMHWYVTWYSHAHSSLWKSLFAQLKENYPEAPSVGSGPSGGTFSAYLHLIVNWLELDCSSQYFDRTAVEKRARSLPFYQWFYRTVLEDWDRLQKLYAAHELTPIMRATEMTPSDFAFAARANEYEAGAKD